MTLYAREGFAGKSVELEEGVWELRPAGKKTAEARAYDEEDEEETNVDDGPVRDPTRPFTVTGTWRSARLRGGMQAVLLESVDRLGWHTAPIAEDAPRIQDHLLSTHVPSAILIEPEGTLNAQERARKGSAGAGGEGQRRSGRGRAAQERARKGSAGAGGEGQRRSVRGRAAQERARKGSTGAGAEGHAES